MALILKEYRISTGKSQEELAKDLGVSQQCIAKWETGEAFPRADKLPKLAEILGCEIKDFFKESYSEKQPCITNGAKKVRLSRLFVVNRQGKRCNLTVKKQKKGDKRRETDNRSGLIGGHSRCALCGCMR